MLADALGEAHGDGVSNLGILGDLTVENSFSRIAGTADAAMTVTPATIPDTPLSAVHIVYRNAALLTEEGGLDSVQGEALIRAASEAVDRFYPAFNFLIWGGKKPDEALRASLFETQGNA